MSKKKRQYRPIPDHGFFEAHYEQKKKQEQGARVVVEATVEVDPVISDVDRMAADRVATVAMEDINEFVEVVS